MVIEVKIFQGATLARFDLAYLRYHKKTDNISVSQFLFMCFEKIRITHRKVSIDKNNAGLIQRIGHRKNNRCYRIYEDTEVSIDSGSITMFFCFRFEIIASNPP